MDVYIRKTELGDFADVHKLMQQIHKLHVDARPDMYRNIDPMSVDDFHRTVSDSSIVSFVAEKDGKVIGYCDGYLKMSNNRVMTGKKVFFVDDICIDTNKQNSGIGKMLLEEMKSQARRLGAESIELMVWSFNENAIGFYKHMGMTERSSVLEQKL